MVISASFLIKASSDSWKGFPIYGFVDALCQKFLMMQSTRPHGVECNQKLVISWDTKRAASFCDAMLSMLLWYGKDYLTSWTSQTVDDSTEMQADMIGL